MARGQVVHQSYEATAGMNMSVLSNFDNGNHFNDVCLETEWLDNFDDRNDADATYNVDGTFATFNPPYKNIIPTHAEFNYNKGKGPYKLRLTGNIEVKITNTDTGSQTHTNTVGTNVIDITFPSGNDPATPVFEVLSASANSKFELFLPGTIDDPSPFYSGMLNGLQGFACIRNLNWQKINASPHVNWSDRTLYQDKSQADVDYGCAWEYFIDLVNAISGADMWICTPHQAVKDYYFELAKLVKANTNADKKIYVEWSNETWNGAGPFEQTDWAQEQGDLIFPDEGDATNRRAMVTAIRAVHLFTQFQKVFDDGAYPGSHDSSSLKFVLAWQASSNYSRITLTDTFNSASVAGSGGAAGVHEDFKFNNDNTQALVNPSGISAHCLALAPYITLQDINSSLIVDLQEETLTDLGEPFPVPFKTALMSDEANDLVRKRISERYNARWIMRRFFNHPDDRGIEQSLKWMNNWKSQADDLGLELIAYEGGQHLSPVTPHINEYPNWEQMIYAANRHPLMKSALLSYWDTWKKVGGKLHCFFTYWQNPRKGVAFGHLESLDDLDVAKWQAIQIIKEESAKAS